MSTARPFIKYNQSGSMQDASDHINRVRQRTMYGTLANNVMNSKKNGSVNYLGNIKKNNVKYPESSVTPTGCLINAENSSTFLDLSKGMYYCHENNILNKSYINLSGKAWQGPFIQIDIGMVPGVLTWFNNNTSDLFIKFNAITLGPLISDENMNNNVEQNLVDPNYDLYYEPCYDLDSEPFKNYFKYANINSYINTYPYIESIKKRYLRGFHFPAPLKFNSQDNKIPTTFSKAIINLSYHDKNGITLFFKNNGNGYLPNHIGTVNILHDFIDETYYTNINKIDGNVKKYINLTTTSLKIKSQVDFNKMEGKIKSLNKEKESNIKFLNLAACKKKFNYSGIKPRDGSLIYKMPIAKLDVKDDKINITNSCLDIKNPGSDLIIENNACISCTLNNVCEITPVITQKLEKYISKQIIVNKKGGLDFINKVVKLGHILPRNIELPITITLNTDIYSKPINQTCKLFCDITPKICDTSDASCNNCCDDSNITGNKWACCTSKQIWP